MPHGPSSLILYKLGSESWCGCVCMHMCIHVCTPLVSGRRMGWELRSGPVHPPLGRWDLFGSPLMPSDSSLCHVGWGFREGVCFPGICMMVNPTEVATAGPLGSLVTRPSSAP